MLQSAGKVFSIKEGNIKTVPSNESESGRDEAAVTCSLLKDGNIRRPVVAS